jgi:GNAT superfamily N-acetyltransferase
MTATPTWIQPVVAQALCASSGFKTRPIQPDDAVALVQFHQRLSSRSIRLRYFYPHLELRPAEVAHLTCVDGVDRVALVVEHDGEIVAVGRYDRLDDPSEAEVAFVVADDYQHHGIATMLLQELAVRARRAGIRSLRAEVLAENATMLSVFRSAGFPYEESQAFDVIDVRMQIDDAPPHAG